MTPTEAIPGHLTGRVDATIGVLHNTVTPVLIIIAVTPHQRLSIHRSSSNYSKDHCRSRSHSTYKTSKKTLYKSSYSSSRTPVKPQDRKHYRVMIDDPQTDYYSTDDTSSDSKDDEGHLN